MSNLKDQISIYTYWCLWRSFSSFKFKLDIQHIYCALTFPSEQQINYLTQTELMDSNTITFNMIPSGAINVNISPQMAEEISEQKVRLNEDESTNFVEYQNFKNASNCSSSTAEKDSSCSVKIPCSVSKTKQIQKQRNVLKQSQKLLKNQNCQNFNCLSSKTTAHQNLQNKNVIASKSKVNAAPKSILKDTMTAKRPVTVKFHQITKIFDWMMEIASLIKLSRTVLYRACNLFYQTYKIDQRIIQNMHVQKYSSACLLISAKFQKSNMDYLQQIYRVNRQIMSKQLITATQIAIYQTLNWKLPLLSLITEQIQSVFQKWNNYLQKCQKMSLVRKQTRQRLCLNLKYSQNQPLKNKIYGEILYLIDIVVMNQPKRYMNTFQPQSGPQSFILPIVISMYSVFTIQLGDAFNKEQFLLPLFKNFYREQLQRTAIQIDRLPKEIQLSFLLFNFAEHISKIPLTKSWKEAIQNDIQAYFPVNVVKKNQIK